MEPHIKEEWKLEAAKKKFIRSTQEKIKEIKIRWYKYQYLYHMPNNRLLVAALKCEPNRKRDVGGLRIS